MFAFLYQNLATILISLVLLTLFVLALVHIFKKKGGCACSGCSGHCAGCPAQHAGQMHSDKTDCCGAYHK